MKSQKSVDVQVNAHKDATKKIAEEARVATRNLKKLLEDNHFTLTIVLGITGMPKRKTNAR